MASYSTKPRLLALPLEILQKIIWLSMPEGYEALMLACRTTNHAGQFLLHDHNQRRAAWRRFSWDGNVMQGLVLVHDLVRSEPAAGSAAAQRQRRPMLNGLYAETADFRAGSDRPRLSLTRQAWVESGPFRKLDELRRLQDGKAMSDVRKCIGDSPWLRAAMDADPRCALDVDAWVDEHLAYVDTAGNVDSAVSIWVFLLTQLPNVRELTLPMNWNWDMRVPPPAETAQSSSVVESMREKEEVLVWRVLEQIMLANRRWWGTRTAADGKEEALLPPHPPPPPPLHRLHRLEALTFLDGETHTSLERLSPLLLLPSLRELRATSVKAAWSQFEWRFPRAFESRLRVLELSHSCVYVEAWETLLPRLPELEVLRYSHMCKHHGDGYDFDAGGLVECVARHLGDKELKELSVTVETPLFGDVETGVELSSSSSSSSSLLTRRLRKLRKLELELTCFLGPSRESGQRQGMVSQPPKEGWARWDGSQVPPLRDFFLRLPKKNEDGGGEDSGGVEEFELFISPKHVVKRGGVKALEAMFAGWDGEAREEARREGKGLKRFVVRCAGASLVPSDNNSGQDSAEVAEAEEVMRKVFGTPPWLEEGGGGDDNDEGRDGGGGGGGEEDNGGKTRIWIPAKEKGIDEIQMHVGGSVPRSRRGMRDDVLLPSWQERFFRRVGRIGSW